jgi:hypothetical protein
LSVIIVNAAIPNIIILSVIIAKVITQIVIRLNVILQSVVTPVYSAKPSFTRVKFFAGCALVVVSC